MIKAIVQNGVFVPQEPLPGDWTEGVEVEVARPTHTESGDAIDQWYLELEASASQMASADSQTLKAAIKEVRAQEKELARKQLGSAG